MSWTASTLHGDIEGEDLDISMPKCPDTSFLPRECPSRDGGGLDLRSKSFWVPGTLSISEG